MLQPAGQNLPTVEMVMSKLIETADSEKFTDLVNYGKIGKSYERWKLWYKWKENQA